MRALGLERRILILVMLPILGGLIPGIFMVVNANRDLQEMRRLNELAKVVWKLGELDARIDEESSNWYFFTPTFKATPDERKSERVKQDKWRISTDATVASYRLLESEVDISRLSVPLRDALNSVDQDIAALPDLRRTVDTQPDDQLGNAILSYRGFRQNIGAVLPLLVDATSSNVITRKLAALPKLMLIRKTAMETGGMIFFYHQLRVAKSDRHFTSTEAIRLIHGAELSEIYWADAIASSQGAVREHLRAVHNSPEWKTVVRLLIGHGNAALNGTPPLEISGEDGWAPSWLFLQERMNVEINSLREDFTRTCTEMTEQASDRRLWASVGLFAGTAFILWLTLQLGHSITKPISATTRAP